MTTPKDTPMPETHTTPSDPVLRWEGGILVLGSVCVACIDALEHGTWLWRCAINSKGWHSPTEAEARTAAEQAVRDWLARAGLVQQGGEPVAWMYTHPKRTSYWRTQRDKGHVEDGWTETPLYAHPPASPTAEMVEAAAALIEHYTQLVNCGDCGSWDPEQEPVVIRLRAALAKVQP